MRSIAERIEAWVSLLGEAWSLGDGVVAWAREHGADGRRAWLECPRADYLVTLAAVSGFDRVVLQRETCTVVRGFETLMPEHRATFAALSHQAEAWMRGTSVPLALPRALDRLTSELRDTARRADDEEARARSLLDFSLAAAVEATRAETHGLDEEEAAKVMADVLEYLTAPGHSLGGLWRFFEARQRRAAAAYASRAAVACVALAKVAELAATSRAILGSAACSAAGGDALWRKTHLRLTDLERRIFALAGEIFHFASLAHATHWGASREAIAHGVEALATTSEANRSTPAIELVRSGTLVAAFEVAIVERTDERAARALLAYAERLRAAAPADALAFDERDPRTRRSAQEPERAEHVAASKAALEAVLEGLLAVMTPADEPLAAALHVAVAVLRADGPLHRAALARVLIAVHEHFDALVVNEARVAGGREAERWRSLSEALDAQIAFFAKWLLSGPAPRAD